MASENEIYCVKKAKFHNAKTFVICQNVNGPCPLIAICNALLLRGDLVLPNPKNRFICQQELLVILSELLCSRRANKDLNYEHNLNDCLSMFHLLPFGLNVNVKFSEFVLIISPPRVGIGLGDLGRMGVVVCIEHNRI
eukprot:TRINITY_DN17748_c0_g1_i1.p1 TRINITY_DN17748_c0_g1~~TRINITY_DN17748_c0_g1_i1.p1  ORF type:complete len:148 (-),score=26.70 TRINITY_DN17748_c0_g1_i1:127-540(-)